MSFIRFAPLWIPLSRRLEMMGVLAWASIWALSFIGTYIPIYTFFYTDYWYVVLCYAMWICYDWETPRKGGRRWKRFWRFPFPKWFCQYFPLRLVNTATLDPSRNYLVGCHPHGILCTGMAGNLACVGNNADLTFPGLQTNFLTLDIIFYVPIFRDFVLAAGGCSVSRKSIRYLLQNPKGGNMVLMVPGGAREALYSHPGSNEIYLKKRKGFIKAAIETGCPLVPVYSFGENDIFTPIPNPNGSLVRRLQEKFIDWIGAPVLIWNGRGIFQYSFGILPRRSPITTVVGPPIEVKQMEIPTAEYVDEVHTLYVKQLLNLYNTHRELYGNPKSDLIIN